MSAVHGGPGSLSLRQRLLASTFPTPQWPDPCAAMSIAELIDEAARRAAYNWRWRATDRQMRGPGGAIYYTRALSGGGAA